VIAGLYARRVLSAAAITSIVAAVTVTVIVRQLTANEGYGILSPPAIGIVTAALTMLAFRFIHPQEALEKISFAEGTHPN
jgi:SSS family solute:Na+ symporter